MLNGKNFLDLPKETMLGALSLYISDESVKDFQPMGSNMGILPSLPTRIKDKKLRYQAIANIALEKFEQAIKDLD